MVISSSKCSNKYQLEISNLLIICIFEEMEILDDMRHFLTNNMYVFVFVSMYIDMPAMKVLNVTTNIFLKFRFHLLKSQVPLH